MVCTLRRAAPEVEAVPFRTAATPTAATELGRGPAPKATARQGFTRRAYIAEDEAQFAYDDAYPQEDEEAEEYDDTSYPAFGDDPEHPEASILKLLDLSAGDRSF